MLGCTFCTVHAKTAKLSNPKASKEARKLYKTLWHTSHVQRHNKEELRRIYHHPDVITLDELQSAK